MTPKPARHSTGCGRRGAAKAGSMPGAAVRLLYRSHDRVEVERRRLLARRERLEFGDLVRHQRLHRIEDVDVRDQPIPVGVRVLVSPLERIAAQVDGSVMAGSQAWQSGSRRCYVRTAPVLSRSARPRAVEKASAILRLRTGLRRSMIVVEPAQKSVRQAAPGLGVRLFAPLQSRRILMDAPRGQGHGTRRWRLVGTLRR